LPAVPAKVVFALPWLGCRQFRLNAILAFWISYVLTRAVGASFADWAGKAWHPSGLGLGTGEIAVVLTVVVVILVRYVTISRKGPEGDRPANSL
jgi:uncharacterized membrane-anchored protein